MANDFSVDSRCKALWKFESGALTTDSKGTNTLTNHGVTEDLVNIKEGGCAADFELSSAQYLQIADASLDAGFPLKNGDATKKITVCFWARLETVSAPAQRIFARYNSTTSKRGLAIGQLSSKFWVAWGTGTAVVDYSSGPTLVVGQWYHVAVVVDGVAKTLTIRIWDETAGVVYSDSYAPTSELYVGDVSLTIGTQDNVSSYYDGILDEIVVFNDLLSATEIDKIRKGTFPFGYEGQVPLTITPQAETYGPHAYSGQVPLTLIPQSICGGPHTPYVGALLLRMTPIAAYEPVGPGLVTDIPASTGGWAMGGAGVWTSSTPTDTVIPEIDPTTGLPTESLTGFMLGGGTAYGEAEVVSTIPETTEIVAEGGFAFCGPGVTGAASSTEPPQEVIEAAGGFAFGGEGVWGQVAPEDIPSTVLVGSGGYVLSGTGQLPAVTPTTTVLVPTGGWKLGGRRPDPVEVTYPGTYDRVIEETIAFEMGGDEGIWESSTPGITVIISDGALFALGGAGLATTKMPPIAVITGDALGGFVLAGATPAEVFEAWVLSGQAFEPSVFSGFNFNSFAQHQGQTYAAGEDGIYLLGADNDAGETINSGVRIGPINAGFDGEKRLRSIQFGSGGNGTSVRVRTDDGEEGVFKTDRDSNRVVVSRDIQGREFTIDILDFEELSHCEITPLRLARR